MELETLDHDVSSLTSVISSGGVAPTGHWDRLETELDVELTTDYGMSETTASTTVTRPDDPPQRRRTTNGRLRDEADGEQLATHCAERLARFTVPQQVLPIDADDIPTTPSGRPRKFLLAERAEAQLLGEDR